MLKTKSYVESMQTILNKQVWKKMFFIYSNMWLGIPSLHCILCVFLLYIFMYFYYIYVYVCVCVYVYTQLLLPSISVRTCIQPHVTEIWT